MNDFMLYFNLFIAAYVLYYAIRGEGKVYENDYPEAIKEDHKKFLRKFCWVIGVGMLPLTILEFVFNGQAGFSFLSWINIGYVMACIIVYLVIFKKRFGKYVYPSKNKSNK